MLKIRLEFKWNSTNYMGSYYIPNQSMLKTGYESKCNYKSWGVIIFQTIAEIYESDIADLEKAMQHYEQAADYFRVTRFFIVFCINWNSLKYPLRSYSITYRWSLLSLILRLCDKKKGPIYETYLLFYPYARYWFWNMQSIFFKTIFWEHLFTSQVTRETYVCLLVTLCYFLFLMRRLTQWLILISTML